MPLKHPQRTFYWFAIAVLSVLFFTIKFGSPYFVDTLYQHQKVPLLNFLSQTPDTHTLDYYTGVIQDKLSGPISSVLSGIIFVMLCLGPFKNCGVKAFFSIAFLFLVMTKFETFFNPPYGDPISGPWAEIIWLNNNDFNYIEFFKQPEYAAGGPKVYFFTIFSGLMTLLIRLLPSSKIFLLVVHLLYVLMGAHIVTLLRRHLSQITDVKTSSLVSIFVLSLPLFQSMMELLNMEFPCLYLMMLCTHYLADQRMFKASLAAILAVSIKLSGAIACGAVFAMSSLALLSPSEGIKQKAKTFLPGIIPITFGITLVVLSKTIISVIREDHNETSFLVGLPNVVHSKFIFPLFMMSLAVLIITVLVELFRKKRPGFLLYKYHTVLVMFVMVVGWGVSFSNLIVMGHRYKLLIIPFLAYIVTFAVTRIITHKTVRIILLVPAILFAYFCSYGFPIKPQMYTFYSYNKVVKSLEYRNELQLHLKMAKEFDENYSDYNIGAPFVTAQLLGFPELGCVAKALNVIIYNMNITYGEDRIRNFRGLNNLDIRKTIWIGFESKTKNYPIDPKDVIVKEIVVGNKKATLFVGGIGIEKMWRLVMLERLKRRAIK